MWEQFDDEAVTFKSITSRNSEVRPWANIEVNPTKPKMNPKKPNQIRSTMARVGAGPDHKSRYECLTIVHHFENREVFKEGLQTYTTP